MHGKTGLATKRYDAGVLLELRQYKNNSDQFEIRALFHHLYGKRKKEAISNVEFFQTDRSYSYIVLALVESTQTQFSEDLFTFSHLRGSNQYSIELSVNEL